MRLMLMLLIVLVPLAYAQVDQDCITTCTENGGEAAKCLNSCSEADLVNCINTCAEDKSCTRECLVRTEDSQMLNCMQENWYAMSSRAIGMCSLGRIAADSYDSVICYLACESSRQCGCYEAEPEPESTFPWQIYLTIGIPIIAFFVLYHQKHKNEYSGMISDAIKNNQYNEERCIRELAKIKGMIIKDRQAGMIKEGTYDFLMERIEMHIQQLRRQDDLE